MSRWTYDDGSLLPGLWCARTDHPGVCFTRVATRSLDDDNLAYAFKAWRDGLAEVVGIDDGSPRWVWEYHQRKGLAAVEVQLEVLAPDASVVAGNGVNSNERRKDGSGHG